MFGGAKADAGEGNPLDAKPGAPPTAATAMATGAAAEMVLTPHVMVMTATPIPRTLALTLFGDLDISTIRTLPPGRKPVATRVVAERAAEEVYKFIRKRVDQGEQAYVVVPAIDAASVPSADAEGEVPGGGRIALKNVKETMERLGAGALAGKRLGAMHGRLSAAEREQVMQRFRAGEIDVLVSTSVIEVGGDVPNATVMVVEHAERFGLAQLHQ